MVSNVKYDHFIAKSNIGIVALDIYRKGGTGNMRQQFNVFVAGRFILPGVRRSAIR